jgi:hypothetical protein
MELSRDVAPPPAAPLTPNAPPDEEPQEGVGQSKFSRMLAEVERHRTRVSTAIFAALVARLLFEFKFVSLVQNSANLIVQVPYIGLAVLSYLLVLMWMAMKTRDRFGFGMALGIGVLEATYLLVFGAMQRPFDITAAWPPFVVALAHLPMAFFAFRASTSYPPLDSKRPWIVGFVTALVFLAIPWVAPTLLDAIS